MTEIFLYSLLSISIHFSTLIKFLTLLGDKILLRIFLVNSLSLYLQAETNTI